MAALNFPNNPTDGQLYPDPPETGVIQYIFSSAKGTWLTVAQGVIQVKGKTPIVIEGTRQIPLVTIPAASATQSGYMTAADKSKLDSFTSAVSAVTAGVGLGAPNTGDTITSEGTINLLAATSLKLGGIIPGAGLTVQTNGSLTVNNATPTFPGVVKPGAGLSVTPDGTLNSTGGLEVLRDISPGFNGIQTIFTLQRMNGSVFTPAAATNLMIFVGGVIQIPGNSFAINNAQIIFTSAPPTGATFYGVAIT